MQCKNHPNRRAEHFCTSCRIPLCNDCAEKVEQDEYYCFECAMIQSVSKVSTSLIDKRKRAVEKKRKVKKKWGPFQFFVIASSALILVMWGVILFGGQKAPAGTIDFSKNERVLLFMVDGALKRYAHDEGNQYPEELSNLIPKYLSFGEDQRQHLERLSYQRDPKAGYRLSLANPKPDEMKIMISPVGIKYDLPSGGGA